MNKSNRTKFNVDKNTAKRMSDDGIVFDGSFRIGERTFLTFRRVLELVGQLLLFGRHGRNNSNFHAY